MKFLRTFLLLIFISSIQIYSQVFTLSQDNNPLRAPSIYGADPFLTDIDADGDIDILATEIDL